MMTSQFSVSFLIENYIFGVERKIIQSQIQINEHNLKMILIFVFIIKKNCQDPYFFAG